MLEKTGNLAKYFFIFISWAIVGFGQPAWISWLAPLAACGGYALFWSQLEREESLKRKFLCAFIWFSLVQVVQLSWMTAVDYQGFYILGVYLALCLWLGLQFGALTLLVGRIPHVGVAAFWTLLEWARVYFICGFSWNPVGISLAAYESSLQLASIGGIFGLSFWVILTNLAAFKRKWPVWAVMAGLPYFFGFAHLLWHQGDLKKSPTLSVGLVQTGLLPSEKTLIKGREKDFISPYEQWGRILSSLQGENTKFDLIVMPESVVPIESKLPCYQFDRADSIVYRALGQHIPTLLKREQSSLSNMAWLQIIANAFSSEVVAGLDAEEGGHFYSSAFHVTPSGSQVSRYEKQILVPLAEYLPFAWLQEWTQHYGITDFFTHGTQAKVFSGKVPLSISICYEETFSHLMREGRKKGAEMFVNVTNDSWYPFSRLPRQHFTHARVRAVENGIPLVRACNTGVTTVVDSLGGQVGHIFSERYRGVLSAQVPMYHYRTLYLLWGDYGVVGVSVLLLATSLFSAWRHRRPLLSIYK